MRGTTVQTSKVGIIYQVTMLKETVSFFPATFIRGQNLRLIRQATCIATLQDRMGNLGSHFYP